MRRFEQGLTLFFGLITAAIIALAWHLPFVWLGGKANFAGTYLAYCYGSGPYMPLTALATLVFAAALPAEALKVAINPSTANQAWAIAKDHPDTSVGTMLVGCSGMFGITIWATVVTFRCLSFAHALTGWRLAGAILLSCIATLPISYFLTKINKVFLQSPDDQVDRGLPTNDPQPEPVPVDSPHTAVTAVAQGADPPSSTRPVGTSADSGSVAESSPVFCFNCGHKLHSGAKFCSNCGAKTDDQ